MLTQPALTLAYNPVVTNLLVVFFLIVCVSMILIVLIQRPQGGGLSGAFGAGGAGQGAGQTAFGTKTGDVLTWGTVSVFVIYLLVAIALNFVARPDTTGAAIEPTLDDPAQQGEQPAPEELPPLPGADTPVDGASTPEQTLPESWPEADPANPDDATVPDVDPASAEVPA